MPLVLLLPSYRNVFPRLGLTSCQSSPSHPICGTLLGSLPPRFVLTFGENDCRYDRKRSSLSNSQSFTLPLMFSCFFNFSKIDILMNEIAQPCKNCYITISIEIISMIVKSNWKTAPMVIPKKNPFFYT